MFFFYFESAVKRQTECHITSNKQSQKAQDTQHLLGLALVGDGQVEVDEARVLRIFGPNGPDNSSGCVSHGLVVN